MPNPCQERYDDVENKRISYYDQQSEGIIRAFRKIFPYRIVFREEISEIPGLQFDDLKNEMLYYPDYIKSFYEIATRFGYNEIGMIKDSIELLGLLKNPNQNKDTIYRLLQLPVIDDISFDSKDTFSIFSEKLGDFRFTLVTEALKDNQELMEYLEEAPFAHYHAYSISPDRKTIFDLTYNGIFSLEDYERLEKPSPIYSEQYERLILDIGYALDNSGLDPDTEWLLQAALYRTYLDKIDYHGPMREAPKVMEKVGEYLMLNPCQEIYESVEKKGTDYYDQQSERIIRAFQRINPQELIFSPDTEGIPGLQFGELKMAILFEPDYIKPFYDIAKYFGYDERGMIRDAIRHLGMLENPNENEEIIHSLLKLPVIDDISFDSKDTFSIFSEKLGDYHFVVATEALKDNQELMEYLEKVPFASRCYSHTLILAGLFEDNYSEVSLCSN